MENYLQEFVRIFFSNKRLIKRFFLFFAVLTLLLPLVLKQSFEITAEVIVQSKKLSQSDSSTALTSETDKFVPTTLTDMETESNILRSASLSRQTLMELLEEGSFERRESLVRRAVVNPVRNYIVAPIKEHVINPARDAMGMETDQVRDTQLDEMLNQILGDLKVDMLPGSNIISVSLSAKDAAQGTLFVERLLTNYLKNRQNLQSNNLPEVFYEQKKTHYQDRINNLENKRSRILADANATSPTEEITFRLNAINTEEQSLGGYQDRLLESEIWLNYLRDNMAQAKRSSSTNFTFPFTFKQVGTEGGYEDREIRGLGDRLSEQVLELNRILQSYTSHSYPAQEQRKQISLTYRQFLQLIENRIAEREQEHRVIGETIAQKTARIDRFKDRIATLQSVQSELRQLDTEIEALHQAFFAYTQRYEESQQQNELDAALSNARILSPPYEPTEASFPKPSTIIPLGLITGLLLAVSLGYVREYFDHTFKVPAQVAQQLDLPVLLVIDSDVQPEYNPHKPWSIAWVWYWVRQ